MPANRARKNHIRSQQRPGESYTATMRRLAGSTDQQLTTDAAAARIAWDLESQGMGSTEYAATLPAHLLGDAIEGPSSANVLVSFAGDHKEPWPGWWDLLDYTDGEVGALLLSGRHRFTTPLPDDEAVEAALVQIVEHYRDLTSGGHPQTVSADRGPALTRTQLLDDGYYVAAYGDEWTHVTVEDLGDPDDPCWRLDALYSELDGARLEAVDGTTWTDHNGRAVTIHAL